MAVATFPAKFQEEILVEMAAFVPLTDWGHIRETKGLTDYR